jgi:hypothetical protein
MALDLKVLAQRLRRARELSLFKVDVSSNQPEPA